MSTLFQETLYQFVSKFLTENERSPSFGEITQALAISPRSKSLISRSLRALEREGKLILKKEGRCLSISLRTKALPLLGRISAGTPIEAISDYQAIHLHHFLQGQDHFALQVQGDSMHEENILDGDIIICKKTETAHEGDIVVALIDQYHTTLKRISYKMKNMITLVPANMALKPRAYDPARIHIQGLYIGLVRIPF